MKRLLSLALLLTFGAAMVGCEASAKVGDPADTNGDTHVYEKKTTTYDKDSGTVEKKTTEVHTNP